MDCLAMHMRGVLEPVRLNTKASGSPLIIDEVCVGIGGFRKMMDYGGVEYMSRSCDIKKEYKEFYQVLAENDPQHFLERNFGKDGDLLKITEAGDADGCVGGPPCTPWANNGPRQGKSDPQAKVYIRVVDRVIQLAREGSLTFFALENSPNIAKVHNGDETSFLDDMMCRLRLSLPDWSFDVQMSHLTAWWPHTRNRLWLRGASDVLLPCPEEMPLPLAMPGLKVRLTDLLEKGIPNLSIRDISTHKRRTNVLAYTEQIKHDYKAARDLGFDLGEIAVFEVDRALNKKFGGVLQYDTVPSLRVKGHDMFIASVRDVVAEAPIRERAFHRLLTIRERFMLQGQPAEDASKLKLTMAKFASGNAFAVPMVASMVAPLLVLASAYKKRLIEEGRQTSQPAKRIKY